MYGSRSGVLGILAAIAMLATACSQPPQDSSETTQTEASAESAEPSGDRTQYEFPEETVDGALQAPREMASAPPAADPVPAPAAGPQPMNAPPTEAPVHEDIAGAPLAPESSAGGGGSMMSSAPAGGSAMPPTAAYSPSETHSPPAPVAPPAAANGNGPKAMPVVKNGHGGSKVLSYFQKSRTHIDTRRAFGFVLMPKVAVSDEDRRAQKSFCTIVLASMDFMTPGAVASAPRAVLATYWPIVASRASFEIGDAFARRDCDELIAWYDHALARSLATKAGVAELSGPLLITWPSSGAEGEVARDPLIVDFSKANHARATKALQYWFRQLKARPDLWTSRIREGTIRAELADAVNDTAGVMLAVLSGKWDSLTVVASAAP